LSRDRRVPRCCRTSEHNGEATNWPCEPRTNGAWLACATMAYNLTRAAGALAGGGHARARTATPLRARVAARLARSTRHLTLHLPEHWPWQHDLDRLLRATLHDPVPTATA
jgi:hypothetical protein